MVTGTANYLHETRDFTPKCSKESLPLISHFDYELNEPFNLGKALWFGYWRNDKLSLYIARTN